MKIYVRLTGSHLLTPSPYDLGRMHRAAQDPKQGREITGWVLRPEHSAGCTNHSIYRLANYGTKDWFICPRCYAHGHYIGGYTQVLNAHELLLIQSWERRAL